MESVPIVQGGQKQGVGRRSVVVSDQHLLVQIIAR